MSLEGFLNSINPKKIAWWRQENWVYQEKYHVFEIIEEHNGCSWDIEIFKVKRYKHKKKCEGRIREDRGFTRTKTVFEDPRDGYEGMINIENVDTYEGPKYE